MVNQLVSVYQNTRDNHQKSLVDYHKILASHHRVDQTHNVPYLVMDLLSVHVYKDILKVPTQFADVSNQRILVILIHVVLELFAILLETQYAIVQNKLSEIHIEAVTNLL